MVDIDHLLPLPLAQAESTVTEACTKLGGRKLPISKSNRNTLGSLAKYRRTTTQQSIRGPPCQIKVTKNSTHKNKPPETKNPTAKGKKAKEITKEGNGRWTGWQTNDDKQECGPERSKASLRG